MKKEIYQGIFPALYACYDSDGEVSIEGTKRLSAHLLKKGVKGLYVGGSSGECIYQSLSEKKAVLAAVMEEVGDDLTIIAHVGCNNTKDSMELAAYAESLGVDAIASIPPIYFKLPEYAVAKYWNDMSSAAPNTDFIIYNIPQLAGISLTMPLLREMIKNPKVIGVKNSSMPVQDIQMFKDAGTAGGRDFVVFNGPDEQLLSGLMIGADGGIGGTYAAMPELFLEIYNIATKGGDFEKARHIQYAADRIIYKMCEAKGNMYAVIKEILKIREGLELGGVRAPLYNLVPEDGPIVKSCVDMINEAIAHFI